MSIQDIIRAWKDPNFRESLNEQQRQLLPDNPVGEVLSQEDLLQVSGGGNTAHLTDILCDSTFCSAIYHC